MATTDETLTELVSTRATAEDRDFLVELGAGSPSRGMRRAIRLVRQLQQTGSTAQPDARLSQLLEQALKLAHGLEAAADADVSSSPSGAGWMPNPTADLILQFHQLMPGALLAMPQGLMVWGKGQGDAEAGLSIDLGQGLVTITDLARDEDAGVAIDGTADLAAIADTLAQGHHQARLAAAKGKPIASAVAECPALRLRVRPDDGHGLAVIELAGAVIHLHPLAYLQLVAEASSLLAREVARSVDQRHGLEQLLQTRPVVAGARSHGEG